MVSMVSDGLDVRGPGYGVYGACSFGPGWSGLWWVGAMMSMVFAGLDLGGRGYSGLWCLWCLLVWTWVVQAMVSMVSDALDVGGPSYGVYDV